MFLVPQRFGVWWCKEEPREGCARCLQPSGSLCLFFHCGLSFAYLLNGFLYVPVICDMYLAHVIWTPRSYSLCLVWCVPVTSRCLASWPVIHFTSHLSWGSLRWWSHPKNVVKPTTALIRLRWDILKPGMLVHIPVCRGRHTLHCYI